MSEIINDISFEDIRGRVEKAVQCLVENDLYLFENGACERAITHRFAVCLERVFPDWHVDCEYNLLPPDNQNVIEFKYANLMARRRDRRIENLPEEEAVSVYPDIIVHRRGTNENLLVIEVKRSNDRDEIRFDRLKLYAYCQDKHLNYRYALLIRFQKPEKEKHFVDAQVTQWIKNVKPDEMSSERGLER